MDRPLDGTPEWLAEHIEAVAEATPTDVVGMAAIIANDDYRRMIVDALMSTDQHKAAARIIAETVDAVWILVSQLPREVRETVLKRII